MSRNSYTLKASIGVRKRGLNYSILRSRCLHPASITGLLACTNCLFLRTAWCLDAFSTYQLWRSYSAMPYQTTDKPEATEACSFRTYTSFLSGRNTSSRYRPNWLTPFWTQLMSPFNPWTPAPLAAAARPGQGKPTATPQRAGSICSPIFFHSCQT